MNMHQTLDGVTVAMLQLEIGNDPQQNAKKIVRRATRAAQNGADIIVGSEMMLTHYLSGDRYEDDDFMYEMEEALAFIARRWQREAVLIIGSIALGKPEEVGEDGRLRKYNAAFVIQNGRFVLNRSDMPYAIKSLLPNYRIFDDARHFFDLRKVALERGVSLASLQQPFPVTVRGRQLQLGVMLCEDMWDGDYAHKPAKNLAENGADILINLSCSPWSWQKNRKRDQVVRDITRATGLSFVYVNNVGVQNNGKNFLVFDGASTVYNQEGASIALAPRYEEVTEMVTFNAGHAAHARPEQPDVAELYRAITVATRGFLKTLPVSVGKKVVIGVSGGMDSALSVAFFARLLGPKNVIALNLPYGSFNSKETKDDAAELCRRLGVEYRVIPIDQMVNARCSITGIDETSSAHKTVQAMERKAVEAAVAAQEGAFIICNANMTEIAFGYGTLNGDLRGTFAPWMNCLKQDVYRLGAYLNAMVYKREVIPQSIIDREPMDELSVAHMSNRGDPFDYGTVDENGYHDQMVRAMVVFRRSPAWFLKEYLAHNLEAELRLPEGRLQALFPSPRAFIEDLERCLSLFHDAVFKRVQSVPGPLVEKRSFGFDFRESMLPIVWTEEYARLRTSLLATEELR